MQYSDMPMYRGKFCMKFTIFAIWHIREMFSPKQHKARFEQDLEISTVKSLILNEIGKSLPTHFSQYTYNGNCCIVSKPTSDAHC